MRVWVLEALIADLPSVLMELAILSFRARRSSLAFSLSDRKRIFWGLGRLEDELASLELSFLVFLGLNHLGNLVADFSLELCVLDSDGTRTR